MQPMATFFLTELPYVPQHLKGIELITVFISVFYLYHLYKKNKSLIKMEVGVPSSPLRFLVSPCTLVSLCCTSILTSYFLARGRLSVVTLRVSQLSKV